MNFDDGPTVLSFTYSENTSGLFSIILSQFIIEQGGRKRLGNS